MCKLGNAEAARLKPPPLKIATISGTSPLHEVARESEAIDQTARESMTQMTEAIKTMGKVIDKNENENKQLKKMVSQLAPTLQYCTYCNRSGHTDSICQTKIANEQNQSANSYLNSGSYNALNQSTRNYNPLPSYNQQYHSQGNYSSPPVYQDQGQRQNFQVQQCQNYQGGWNQNRGWNDRGGIMVMEPTQIEEIMVMEEVEMLTMKFGEEILDKAQMGIKITDPLWGTNRH